MILTHSESNFRQFYENVFDEYNVKPSNAVCIDSRVVEASHGVDRV